MMALIALHSRPLCALRRAHLTRTLRRGRVAHQSSVAGVPRSAAASGIDLQRYPLHDFDHPRLQDVLSRARSDLAATGCASFPGFLREDVTAEAAVEAARAAGRAHVTDAKHNAYQLPGLDPSLPEGHVRNLRMGTKVASTPYDELRGPLRRLYEFDGLVRFVGAVLGRDEFYRLADPLGACTVNIFRPSWHHAWHFDEAEYTTTLCLQQSESGGEFEFSPPLRSTRSDLAAEAVAGVLRDRSPYRPSHPGTPSPDVPIHTARFEPGTLQIFAGRYSLHHVRKIPDAATRDRYVAVLCYASQPDVVNSPEVQQMFWGRTATA